MVSECLLLYHFYGLVVGFDHIYTGGQFVGGFVKIVGLDRTYLFAVSGVDVDLYQSAIVEEVVNAADVSIFYVEHGRVEIQVGILLVGHYSHYIVNRLQEFGDAVIHFKVFANLQLVACQFASFLADIRLLDKPSVGGRRVVDIGF